MSDWYSGEPDPLDKELHDLHQRVAELEAETSPCREYQKEGESLVECIERNRADAAKVARMLAKERIESE